MILGIGVNADLRTHQICNMRWIRTGNWAPQKEIEFGKCWVLVCCG